eukprot:Nk52_evm13s96 gene=Nk52_evmTU13s96
MDLSAATTPKEVYEKYLFNPALYDTFSEEEFVRMFPEKYRDLPEVNHLFKEMVQSRKVLKAQVRNNLQISFPVGPVKQNKSNGVKKAPSNENRFSSVEEAHEQLRKRSIQLQNEKTDMAERMQQILQHIKKMKSVIEKSDLLKACGEEGLEQGDSKGSLLLSGGSGKRKVEDIEALIEKTENILYGESEQ